MSGVWLRAEKVRGVRDVVGAEERNRIDEMPYAETCRGWEWIAAYVRVKGSISAMIEMGMKLFAMMVMMLTIFRGRRIRGSLMSNAKKVDIEIVPKSVVVAWKNADLTVSCEETTGNWLRWKYHCDTVAPVVAR